MVLNHRVINILMSYKMFKLHTTTKGIIRSMMSSLPVCAIVYQTATEPFITRLFKNKKQQKYCQNQGKQSQWIFLVNLCYSKPEIKETQNQSQTMTAGILLIDCNKITGQY